MVALHSLKKHHRICDTTIVKLRLLKLSLVKENRNHYNVLYEKQNIAAQREKGKIWLN